MIHSVQIAEAINDSIGGSSHVSNFWISWVAALRRLPLMSANSLSKPPSLRCLRVALNRTARSPQNLLAVFG